MQEQIREQMQDSPTFQCVLKSIICLNAHLRTRAWPKQVKHPTTSSDLDGSAAPPLHSSASPPQQPLHLPLTGIPRRRSGHNHLRKILRNQILLLGPTCAAVTNNRSNSFGQKMLCRPPLPITRPQHRCAKIPF